MSILSYPAEICQQKDLNSDHIKLLSNALQLGRSRITKVGFNS